MHERSVILPNRSGLHARPAHRFAEAAAQAGVPIFVRKSSGTTEVNAASVLSVLTLDCRHGDEIVIWAEGEEGRRAVDRLVDLVESGLGENGEAGDSDDFDPG